MKVLLLLTACFPYSEWICFSLGTSQRDYPGTPMSSLTLTSTSEHGSLRFIVIWFSSDRLKRWCFKTETARLTYMDSATHTYSDRYHIQIHISKMDTGLFYTYMGACIGHVMWRPVLRKEYEMDLGRHVCVCVLVTQSCPTLCDPMDYIPPGSSLHGIPQERILEWVVILFPGFFLTQESNLCFLHCTQFLTD